MKTRPMYVVHPIPGLRPPNHHAMHYSFDKKSYKLQHPCCHIFSWLFPWISNIAYNHQARSTLNFDMLRAVINIYTFITIKVPCAGQLQIHIVVTIEVTRAG